MRVNKFLWFLFAFHALVIGLYPFSYFVFDMSTKFFGSKPLELLQTNTWKFSFYTHISFGGIALLTGWSQFSDRIRTLHLSFHRTIGKIYVIAALLSGLAGFYIALYSNGGLITHFGFGILAFLWFYSTTRAYTSIKNKNISNHKKWMIRSYSLCFAAVTLRLWLPLLAFTSLGFPNSYKIVSWLCWIPNIIIAELIINKIFKKVIQNPLISATTLY